ncbi:MAG: hypothetical protein JWQ63_57 [Mucilaginibacter sp.]|nr:hypothetical protein [Mucilaginibacter sp.]
MEASYNSLNYLSDQEYKIHGWTNSLLNGTRKEEDLIFNKDDIKIDYVSIHKEYLKLYKQSNDEFIKLESLKRLIFLNWEFIVESESFTGIVGLEESVINDSYGVLNTYVKSGLLDIELKWMLEYYSDWSWVLLHYTENMPELSQFVKSVDTAIISFPKNLLSKGTMDNRGQMGIFWKPIVEIIDKT